MNILDKTIGYFSPQAAVKRVRSRQVLSALAGFDAAGGGRRNQFLRGTSSSQNMEVRPSLVGLRNNSREQTRNSSYPAIAVARTASLTVGTGIIPKARHVKGHKSRQGKKKIALANALMKSWMCDSQLDYDGQLDLQGIFHLMMREETEAGECLLVRRFSKNTKLDVPLQIQVLEPDYLDHLKDSTDNIKAGSPNLIMGVQFADNGQRSHYWLHPKHPGERGWKSRESAPVPAGQVAHLYDLLRAGQVRGVPRGTPVFQTQKLLFDYRDARLELQKVASCVVGLVTQSEELDESVEGDILPDRLEPGFFGRLNAGDGVEFNSPPSPSGHKEYVQTEEHQIATCYGLTYQELTGDINNANFANSKIGRIPMNQNVWGWQHRMLIPQVCKRVEGWFLMAAELAGYDLDGVYFDWRGPAPEILDLKAEIPAIKQKVRAGLTSWQRELRARNIDPQELIEEWAEDQALWDQAGVILDIDPRQMSLNGQAQAVAEDNGEDDAETDPESSSEPGSTNTNGG